MLNSSFMVANDRIFMICRKYYLKDKKTAKKKRKAFENKFNKKLTIYKCNLCTGFHYTTHTTVEDKEHYRAIYRNKKESG